jgi:hypothetical protein
MIIRILISPAIVVAGVISTALWIFNSNHAFDFKVYKLLRRIA